ncbi:quinol oxidase subunit 2 [Pullulanibacillus camelliae]|uniref:Quinol oxidase subunit 2 n=1 Tax=Pullulanibacillus camelliae TaxID=1707096 RepID=A0A8J3DV00_9BACL|nr:ubiquinol oxidase subunit II [Pullulanibacillus camelliae]GGE44155.1 quinol oxidase subunit 2 [Pullulanibacillus camelliae]
MKSLWQKGFILLILCLIFLTGCSEKYPVLHPVGPVGEKERNLIILSAVLMAIVIIPVIALLAFIVYRYRDKPNNRAPYKPNWDDSKILEFVWWGIPIIIIAVLSIYTVRDTFALTKPPANTGEPISIQVTSLDWKWVFFYPDEGVATVNYIDIPAGRPVQFELTSDAPMNSFWIPALGGQEYTMPGMAMRLWLQANKVGTYTGKGANFTGKEFSKMSFAVHVKKETDFDQWVKALKNQSPQLTEAGYKQLKKPGVVGKKSFSSYPKDIFHDTVMKNGGKYMNNDWMMKDHSQEMKGK